MEITKGAWMYWLCFLAVITGTTCIQINIHPRRDVVRNGDSISVVCKVPAGTKLKSCWVYVSGMSGIDLSLGRNSQPTDEYIYFGRGLERGQCGISLLRVAHDCRGTSKVRTVTCAVEVEAQGWATAYMAFLVTDEPTFSLISEHPKIDVRPGVNVSILCQSSGIRLNSCTFYGKNLGTIAVSQNSPPVGAVGGAVGHVSYFGEGLDEGDCGITLTDVREEWTGLVWCSANSQYDNWGYDFTTLMIANPPSSVNLALTSTNLKLDEILTATCTVKNAHPAVQFSWDSPFDEGVSDVFGNDVTDAKLDYETRTVAQVMSKRVTATDHLKSVRCAARLGNGQHESVAQRKVKVRFCGKRNEKNARPLVASPDGKAAKTGEFPWHIAFYTKKNNTYSYMCGGSIISTKHVISAAHCFWSNSETRMGSPSAYAAAAGKSQRLWEKDEHAQRFNIAEITKHDNYRHDLRRFEDDIAIVKLDGELVFSGNVQPICMDWSMVYEPALLVNGSSGIAPGWGFTEDNTLADNLLYVEIPYMDMPQCHLIVPRAFREYLAPGKFCAGFITGGTSVCAGDSGGGLVFKPNTTSPSQSYYLLGIVSIAPQATSSRCNTQQVSVFTTVSSYYPFIRKVLDEDDANNIQYTKI